jgi:hypothetical protein
MKNNLLRTLPALGAMLLALSSWNAHKLGSVTPSAPQVAPFGSEEGKVLITAKAYTHEESKVYLQRDLLDRGVQPLQVTIQNNTPNSFSVSASSVDLPHLEPSKVAFRVTKSAIPRAVAWKVASFFFWPLMIPSAIDGIRTMHTHSLLKRSFKAKCLKDEVILPYSTLNRILFVPEEKFKKAFDVTVIDLETLELWSYPIVAEGLPEEAST